MPSTKRIITTNGPRFEQIAFDTLNRDQALYAPLEVINAKQQGKYGGVICLAWQGREVEFHAEVKSRTAPKIVQEAFWNLRNETRAVRERFLLVVPFITDSIRTMVEKERVSCIDLSGNYLILNPKLLAVRLDQKNRFPESAPIKKIFSGNSSQVGRLLLAKKHVFSSVGEVAKAIEKQGLPLSLSTISKVLSGLIDELIIEKTADRIVLLQPSKLLDRLQAEYVPPKTITTLKAKLPGNSEELRKILSTKLGNAFWMLSGESSVDRYATTTAPSILRVYAYQAGELPKFENENPRFFNVVIESVDAPFVYFDRQKDNKFWWASPLQTYLELSRMDKREQEIAETIREGILKELS